MTYVSPYLNRPLRSQALARIENAPCGIAKFNAWYSEQTRRKADARTGLTFSQCVKLEAES